MILISPSGCNCLKLDVECLARSFHNLTDRLLFCVAIIKLANEFFPNFSANLIDAKFDFLQKGKPPSQLVIQILTYYQNGI